MGIVNSDGLSLVGARAEFMEKYEATQALWPDVTTTIKSTAESESYRWLGSVPPVRNWDGGRQIRGMFTQRYDVLNEKFEITIAADRDAISDDKVGAIRLRIGDMAERAKLFGDSEVARLLINGHSAGFNSYDGVPFFSTTHSSGLSGTQSNAIVSDVTTPTNPSAADVRTALNAAIPALLALKDDQGEPMNLTASGLVFVIPPTMYIAFLEAVNSAVIASTTNILQNVGRVVAFPRLTATTIFYVLKVDTQVRGLIYQDREPIEFKQLAEGSEEEFMREQYIFGVRFRGKFTYGYWQKAIKVTLT